LLRDEPEVIDHLLVSGCGTAARLGPIIATGSLLGKPLLHLLKPALLLNLALRQSQIPQPYLSVLLEDVRHLQPDAILHFAAEFVKMQVPHSQCADPGVGWAERGRDDETSRASTRSDAPCTGGHGTWSRPCLEPGSAGPVQ
jgi:hypothetical protein